MSTVIGETEATLAEPAVESRTEMRPGLASSYDSEPENWLSRGIGIFLGLAISAAAVGGVIGLLHLGGRL